MIAPNRLYADSKFTVAVSSHSHWNQIDLIVRILPKSESLLCLSQKTVVKPNTTNLLPFDIGNWPCGEYRIVVYSENDFNFFKEKSIFLVKDYSIYIQMDKARYYQNDLIHFRIIILDSNLKPFNQQGNMIQIHIRDPRNNRLKQFKNITLVKGVYKNCYQLTENPPFGTWRINVYINNTKEETKKFNVEKNVLSILKVEVFTEKHKVLRDETYSMTFESKYVHKYGQYVPGVLKLHIIAKHVAKDQQYEIKKCFPNFTGKQCLHMNFRNYGLHLLNDSVCDIRISFFDPLTNKTAYGRSQFFIHKYPYRLELSSNSQCLEDELYRGMARAVSWNGTSRVPLPYIDIIIQGCSSHKHNSNWPRRFKRKITAVQPNDSVSFDFTPITDYCSYRITAEVRDNTAQRAVMKVSYPCSNSKMIHLLNQAIGFGSVVGIALRSNILFRSITYVIIGQGNILKAETLSSHPNNEYETVFIRIDKNFYPRARIIAYHVIEGTDKFKSDYLDLKFNSTLGNTFNIEVVPRPLKCGDKARIRIQANQDSYIGLLGVNQIEHIQSNNDINQSNILESMKKEATDYYGFEVSSVFISQKISYYYYRIDFSIFRIILV